MVTGRIGMGRKLLETTKTFHPETCRVTGSGNPRALFATPLIFVMLEVGRAFEMSLFLATLHSETTLETFTVAETSGQSHKTSVIHLLQVTVRQLLVQEAM